MALRRLGSLYWRTYVNFSRCQIDRSIPQASSIISASQLEISEVCRLRTRMPIRQKKTKNVLAPRTSTLF